MQAAPQMTTQGPQPTSIVIRASHILLIRIEESQAGEWSTQPDGFRRRTVRLSITLVEILKGAVDAQPGDTLALTITQRASVSPRRPVAPGVWSNQPIDPGTELLTFSHSPNNRAVTSLLAD